MSGRTAPVCGPSGGHWAQGAGGPGGKWVRSFQWRHSQVQGSARYQVTDFSKSVHAESSFLATFHSGGDKSFSGLGKFKQLLEIAPAVLAIVDSTVVYFLSHKNLLETNLKAKRLGTLVHLEYPNLMIMAVKGTVNISDKLSRLFSLPKTLAETISLSHLKIYPYLPEIQKKAFSITEAKDYVTNTKTGIRRTVQ